MRRCRRRRTALASCACASKQCSFSTADRLLWLDQSQRRRRCLQRCACEISASPDSECAVSESRKALHCATILHAHELTSCASSSAGTKPLSLMRGLRLQEVSCWLRRRAESKVSVLALVVISPLISNLSCFFRLRRVNSCSWACISGRRLFPGLQSPLAGVGDAPSTSARAGFFCSSCPLPSSPPLCLVRSWSS